MSNRRNKRRAIQAALGQLGWQASGKEVVALLVEWGIAVSERLVGKVKVAGLKETEEVWRQRANAQLADRHQHRPDVRKIPQPRTYRR
jgi:hypothetical protein